MSYDSPVLPEVNVEPLGDMMLDFLIERDREDASVDFKETLSIAKEAPFAKIAKDIFAFSNYGGGFIFIGFKERPKSETSSQSESKRTFLSIGLPEGFHIDQATLQEKFNSYSNAQIQLQYHEFFRNVDGSTKKFATIYIPPSTSILRPVRKGAYIDTKERKRLAFNVGSVLFRRGTQSIIASKHEIVWIQKRIEKEGYRVSVLSGQPDQIQETLYSNLFEVIKIPEVIWTANPKLASQQQSNKPPNISSSPVYRFWNDKVVTLVNLSEPESALWGIINPSSVQMGELTAWLANSDKQRIVIELLNKELRFLAERLGVLHERKKQKFYYACDGEYRTETWRSRFRSSSTVTVGQRIWAQQLKRFIFWHIAVIGRFEYLGNHLFLKLSPTIQLTDDGRKAIFGTREGTVITRLTYNRYNASYLNSLLFWISKFAEGKDNIALAQGKVIVSSKPVESRIDTGIMSDRPTSEPLQEIPEIQLGG